MRYYSITALSALILTTSASVATGQAELDTMRIHVGIDGRVWQRMSDQTIGPPPLRAVGKLLVLRGILDGLVVGRSPLAFDSVHFQDDDTWGQLVRAVDQFYSDYRNERVFLVWALQIITMERRGSDAAVVDTYLRDMRRRAAALGPK